MTRRLATIRCTYLLLIALITGSLGGTLLPAPAAAQGDLGGTLLALVNNFRASNGLSAWQLNGSLASAAQNHATWIIQTGQYGHTGAGGSTPQDRARSAGYSGIVYENYVYGTGLDPSGALDWWINSPVHLATLLSQTTDVGIGTMPSGRSNLYVLVAGRPSSVRAASRSSGAGSSATGEEEPEEEPGPVVVPISIAEPDASGNVIHTVQQGQTAWAIAARYSVPLDDILDLNGFNLPVVLKPGDQVWVKVGPGQAPPPTPTPPTRAVVREGQTVWEIAVAQGLTVDELLELNGLTRADVIQPGDELWLRSPENADAGTDITPSDNPVDDPGAPAAPASNGVIVMIFTPTQPTTPTPTSLLDALTHTPPETVATTPAPPTSSPTFGAVAAAATNTSVPVAQLASPTVTANIPPPVEPSATATLAPTLEPSVTPTPPVVAAAPTHTPVIVAPTATPATKDSGDSSGPDMVVVLGLVALGIVWIAVLGVGLVSWLGKKR